MPNDPDRLDRIEASIEKLTAVVETLAAAVVARDNQTDAHTRQIGALIELASKHEKAIANLEKQWAAYLNTIHPKH